MKIYNAKGYNRDLTVKSISKENKFKKNTIKSFLLIILLLTITNVVLAQQKYTVKGQVLGMTEGTKVYLQFRSGKSVFVNDSTTLTNGSFIFQGVAIRPNKATLVIRSVDLSKKSFALSKVFYLGSGLTAFTATKLGIVLVKGGKYEDEYKIFEQRSNNTQDSIDQYTWKSIANGKDTSLKIKLNLFINKMDAIVSTYISENKNSYVSLDLVGEKAFAITDPQQFEALYNLLGPDMKNTPEGRKDAELLYLTKRLAIGQSAIDFTQNDPDGKPISLASLKGKYVLIDFWASWCGPCRMEYPFLKKAYSLFKDQNFVIISVSLDSKKAAWVQAIKEYDFPWLQVCDFKGFKNQVAEAYGVYAIPRSFLIDPNGIIIAKDLRSNNLIEKLKEVIKP